MLVWVDFAADPSYRQFMTNEVKDIDELYQRKREVATYAQWFWDRGYRGLVRDTSPWLVGALEERDAERKPTKKERKKRFRKEFWPVTLITIPSTFLIIWAAPYIMLENPKDLEWPWFSMSLFCSVIITILLYSVALRNSKIPIDR